MTEDDKKRRAAIKKATAGHTDLNTFAIVRAILESGALYNSKSQGAARRIIAICNKECARLLNVHDEGVSELAQ